MSLNEPKEQNVSGSTFAKKAIQNGTGDNGYYDIAKGADTVKGNNDTYWQSDSGAFGQYFFGSLHNLGLVETYERSKFIRRSEKGKHLADAYNKSISPHERSLFLSIVKEGKLNSNQAEELTGFSLSKEITGTEEWHFYFTMFLGEDNDFTLSGKPLSLRKQSIKLFLDHLNNPQRQVYMPYYLYHTKGSTEKSLCSEAAYGWYYYELNEFTHYALESILWAMLLKLEAISVPIRVNEYIQETQAEVLDVLRNKYKLDTQTTITVQDSIVLCQRKGYTVDYLYALTEEVSDMDLADINLADIIALNILTLISLFQENEKDLTPLQEYAQDLDLIRTGNAVVALRELVGQNKYLEIATFIEKVYYWIINRHLFVAYEKMGSGEDNVLKLMLEDNHLLWLENIGPALTSPRLSTLRKFMTDLRLINSDGQLTKNGYKILNQE
ncbi:hypothetical protein Q0590_28985 [Rhodocytophaga aerolata]|uniref:Uncharacterized protein n=1 Tax=Rhodocytophaga aerolata TaxID=455078 RepID=A0ABT8RE02_9BACT|nr:hypothetical protein [Rhodocytophaga aerolata]MDO1450346.1 hypothetical protein [Rhodocytophaga aerolata]